MYSYLKDEEKSEGHQVLLKNILEEVQKNNRSTTE
jgi:hypothetical protein